MRILHVFDHSIPLHSGYTFRSLAILREQHARGWQTIHVTSSKHGEDVAQQAEETVEQLKFYRTFAGVGAIRGLMNKLPVANQFEVAVGLYQRIMEVAKHEKFDLIHAHSPCLNGLAAIYAGRKLNVPVVYEMRASWEDAAVNHGSCQEGDARYRASRELETFVLQRADAITTICDGLKGDIASRGIPTDRITVIPNAVDIEKFSVGGKLDAPLAQKLGLTGHKVLGFIGSFYQYEGLHLLVEALPHILAKQPQTKLLLVGGGFQEMQLQEQVEALGLQDKVIFTGRVPHEEVQRYYDLVDIFIYPRLNIRLTDLVTPLKPLEAMAQGRLVIASDVGGHREMITPGENGELFTANDANALAKTACELLTNQEGWSDMRRAGRRYVEEVRNWPNSVARYQAVYEGLVSK